MKPINDQDKIILILLGALVFSDVCSVLSQDILHLPLATPEIIFIPFIPFLKRHFYFNKISLRVFLPILMIWGTLLILGIVSSNYSLMGIISNARGYLLLLLAYLWVYKNCNLYLNSAYYIGIGGLLGWLLMSCLNFKNTLVEENVIYGPMLLIPLVLGYIAYQRKPILFLIVSSLCIMIGILSGIRRSIAVTLCSIVLLAIILFLYNKNQFKQYIKTFTILSAVILLSLPYIITYVYQNNEYLYLRIFERTDKALSGNKTAGDQSREKHIKELFTNANKYLLPRGFVSKRTGIDNKGGTFVDLPLLEVVHTLSVIGAIVLFIVIFTDILNLNLNLKRKLVPPYNSILILVFFIMIILLFIEGTFLTFPMYTPITGYFLGLIYKYSHLTKRKKLKYLLYSK